MPNKKFIYISIGVAAILLVTVWYFIWGKKDNQSNPAGTAAVQTTTINTRAIPRSVTAPKKSSSPASPSLSATQRYLDAIRVYKSVGYYFQFVDCHGLPGSLTLKKGKKFMLDNRDGEAHKIAVQGGQTFQIKAYDFAIATAPSKIGLHYITCDGGGAASILVQQ